MEIGGNMKSVFERFCVGLKKVEDAVMKQGYEFQWNEHLGYILTCPSNLGTGGFLFDIFSTDFTDIRLN